MLLVGAGAFSIVACVPQGRGLFPYSSPVHVFVADGVVSGLEGFDSIGEVLAVEEVV
jgi:hypothetical protein